MSGRSASSFDGSAAGLAAAAAQARAVLDAVTKDLPKTGREADSAGNAFTRFGAKITAFQAKLKESTKPLSDAASKVRDLAGSGAQLAASITRYTSFVQGAAAAAGALGQLSGVAGLLPAAALAGGAALATLKLGADGIKQAFSALTPTLDKVKASVSATFEKSFAPAVSNLKTLLPQLTPGFDGVARSIGGVATQATGVLKLPSSVKELNTVFGATGTIIGNVGKFLAPVIQAFLRIGAVGAPLLAQLTGGLGNLGQRFNTFIQAAASDGRLQHWIQAGIDGVKSLGSSLGNIIAIVKDVLGVFGGFNALGGLQIVTKALRDFLGTAQGKDTLKTLADALGTIASTVSGVLAQAIAAIAPALPGLLNAFGALASTVATLASTVGAILVPVLQFLAPVLGTIANFLAQSMGWITPLAVGVGVLAAAFWVLDAAMDANPIGLISMAIVALIALVATIITYWTPIKDFFVGLFNTIANAVSVAANWIGQRFSDALSFVKGVWSSITGFFDGIRNSITSALSRALDSVRSAFSNAWNFVKGVWGDVGSFFSGVWSGIGNGLKSALNGAIRLLNGAIDGINDVTGIVGIPGIPHIPYLARGGTASAGQPYIVGERGPELFIPGRSGRVVSNDQLGGMGAIPPINLTLDLTDSFSTAVQITLDAQNRATVRALRAGAGAAR